MFEETVFLFLCGLYLRHLPCKVIFTEQHCMFQTPLSEAGSLNEGAAAFDAIAAGGPLSVDTGSEIG